MGLLHRLHGSASRVVVSCRQPPGCYGALLLAVMVLSLLSGALINAPQRYELLHPLALANLDLRDGLRGWGAARASVGAAAVPYVRIESRPGAISYIYRTVHGVAGTGYLRVSADLRADALAGAAIEGGAGQLLARGMDQRYRVIAHWPYRVAGLDGGSGWQRHSMVLPLASRVHAVQLVAFVAAGEGALEIRDISVETVRERPLFTVFRYLLYAGWALLVAAALAVLLAPGRGWPFRALAGVAGTCFLLLGVAPQPQVNNVLKVVFFGAQDLVFDASTMLAGLGERRPIAPTDAGTAPAAAPDDEQAAASADAGKAAQPGVEPTATEGPPADAAASSQPAAEVAAEPQPATAPREYWRPPERNLDKHQHALGFVLLAVLAVFACQPRSPLLALPALAGLALTMETLQGFAITREADPWDFVADLVGSGVGILLGMVLLAVARPVLRRLHRRGDKRAR